MCCRSTQYENDKRDQIAVAYRDEIQVTEGSLSNERINRRPGDRRPGPMGDAYHLRFIPQLVADEEREKEGQTDVL
jgi:hypothetical protein